MQRSFCNRQPRTHKKVQRSRTCPAQMKIIKRGRRWHFMNVSAIIAVRGLHRSVRGKENVTRINPPGGCSPPPVWNNSWRNGISFTPRPAVLTSFIAMKSFICRCDYFSFQQHRDHSTPENSLPFVGGHRAPSLLKDAETALILCALCISGGWGRLSWEWSVPGGLVYRLREVLCSLVEVKA